MGIAIRSILIEKYNIKTELKWPNDILIKNKKVCGILSEAACDSDKIHYILTGVGINVNMSKTKINDDIKNDATSLLIESNSFGFFLKLKLNQVKNPFQPRQKGIFQILRAKLFGDQQSETFAVDVHDFHIRIVFQIFSEFCNINIHTS